jgi:hypothetical protein
MGQAAKAAGVSKTTIQRGIKSGRLSASRQDDGSYVIDPAELHRAFPRDGHADGEMKQSVTANATGALQAEIAGLREQIALLKDERDDLRDDRDRWREQATRLLPAPQPAARRGWWPWRRGK